MKSPLPVLAVIALYILHQDFWFWGTAHPLIFGFMPVGLFYHACFSVAASLLLWMLVRRAWPTHLENEVENSGLARDGTSHHLQGEHNSPEGDKAR